MDSLVFIDTSGKLYGVYIHKIVGGKMDHKRDIKSKVLSTLYGGIIGDLLGVPVEFRQRGTFQIEDVVGYGTYNQPPGTWSDDTSLTLCLIENMVEQGTMEDLMMKFVQYQDDGYWTPFGEMFDIGRTTVESITRFRRGILPNSCGGKSVYDNGNGAIMRLAPLTFMLHNEIDFVKKSEVIKQYTETTHAHPRSIVGSIIYVECLIRLYHSHPIEKAIQDIQDLFNENFSEEHVYQQELKHYSRIFDTDFLKTPEEEILSGGYVVHTLEAAIWCLGNSISFKEAVLKAVNLGDDSDTVASITGSLAGMCYKLTDVPITWLDQIARKQDIDELLNRFCEFCTRSATEE